MAGAYHDSVLEEKSPQYAYALAILSGGVAFVVAQFGDTIAVWASYVLLAALFASIWPHGAWQWACWICLPVALLIFSDLIITSSFNRFMVNGTLFAKALPLASLGVYVGSRLSIRKIAYRQMSLKRERKRIRNHSRSTQNPTGFKVSAASVSIQKPSFSMPRHREQIRTIEPAARPQSLSKALIKAAQEGDLDKIELLVAQGVDVNAMSDDKCTPLMIAASGGDAQMVEALFGKGAALDAAGCEGWTALMIATIEGHAEVVRALIGQGANVNAANKRGWTAVRYAVSLDEADILRLLLEARADVNLTDAEGQTALMQAAGEDSSALIKMLLGAGADPHIRDKSGRTALMIARERGCAESIRLLKEAAPKASLTEDTAGGIQWDDDSYLYLLKEELEAQLSGPALAPQRPYEDVTEGLRSALQIVQERIESVRKERLLAPSEIAHKLTLTVREASALSGLPRQHLLEAIEDGLLRARLIKHGWRITRASLDDYIRRLSA